MMKLNSCPSVRVAVLLIVLAASIVRAELPPEAQAAMKKGIIAAQQQDYLLALRFFQDARKLAPDAPEVFYNLGLAESKMPGRELRAIAWFGAYLAANPTAPNAAAVKEQIAVLDVKSQSNILRFLKTVQVAVNQIAGNKDANLCDVSNFWAKAGDITEALKTAALIASDNYKGAAQQTIAEAQARIGDIAGAQMTTDLIQRSDYRNEACKNIAVAQASSGDITGAQRFADLIDVRYFDQQGDDHTTYRNIAQRSIATAQARSGTIAAAQKTADIIPDADSKRMILWEIALAQFKTDDLTAVKKTLSAAALESADLLEDRLAYKARLMGEIAVLQVIIGDIGGADKTANLITYEDANSYARKLIAIAKARSGDIDGAQKTAELIQDTFHKSSAQSAISEVQAKSGDIAGAKETLASAQKTADLIQGSDKGSAQRIIASAQAATGDIAGAQKTADFILDEDWKGRALVGIAEAQAKGGDLADAQRTFGEALKTIDLMQSDRDKCAEQFVISEAQTKSGDIAGAQKTLIIAQMNNELMRAADKASVQLTIATAQANAGNIVNAQKTADCMLDLYTKIWALRAITEAQIKSGDLAAAQKTYSEGLETADLFQSKIIASDWLRKLDDSDGVLGCPLNSEPFLDLAGHLKSMPPSSNPKMLFESLRATAKKIVEAQNVITGMLKQQAKK